MAPSIHPGKVLLGELLARDWNLTETALRTGIDSETLTDILMELEDINPELADKLATATGTEAATWMRMQLRHTAAQAGTPIPIEFEGHVPAA